MDSKELVPEGFPDAGSIMRKLPDGSELLCGWDRGHGEDFTASVKIRRELDGTFTVISVALAEPALK